LHITIPGYDNPTLQTKLDAVIDTFVMNFVRDVKGSVSAEHGIGFQKTSFLEYSKSAAMIEYM